MSLPARYPNGSRPQRWPVSHSNRFIALPGQHFAAQKQSCRRFFDFFQRVGIELDCSAIDQRSHMVLFIERRTDADAAIGFDQSALQFVIYRLVDDQASGGGTALTRSADSTENHGRQSQFKIGVRSKDNGVVSPTQGWFVQDVCRPLQQYDVRLRLNR